MDALKRAFDDYRASIPNFKSGPKAVDLFAGAGGFSLGARVAGFDIVLAIEKDKHACQTYTDNLITNSLTRARLLAECAMSLDLKRLTRSPELHDGCDILLGGPPCQGFSTHRIKGAGVGDPRNDLLLKYFDFVEAIRPKLFLVENVPGLLWSRHRGYLDAFQTLARTAEYELKGPVVLNARDFGVPQNRKRVFILGIDKKSGLSVEWPPPATHFAPREGPSNDEPSVPRWPTARYAFRPPLDGDPNDKHMNHGPELIRVFKATPLNGGSRAESGRQLPCHKRHSGHSDVYGRINPDKPGPTMTTACVNPSKGRFVHPTEPHGITIRQAARLQTFPDWYVFSGGLMASGRQIGNAVPPTMVTALLSPLAAALRSQSQIRPSSVCEVRQRA